MRNYEDEEHINIGTGEDLAIRELAETIREVIYPEAELVFNTDKPDGAPRKLMNVDRLHNLGWRHSRSLSEGIRSTYEWYVEAAANREGAEPAPAPVEAAG